MTTTPIISTYSPIRRKDGWYYGERKQFKHHILGEGVDLSSATLQLTIIPSKGSPTVLYEQDGFDPIEGDGDIVVWTYPETAYAPLTGGRWYYYELWDRSAHVLMAHGPVYLHRARRTT